MFQVCQRKSAKIFHTFLQAKCGLLHEFGAAGSPHHEEVFTHSTFCPWPFPDAYEKDWGGGLRRLERASLGGPGMEAGTSFG